MKKPARKIQRGKNMEWTPERIKSLRHRVGENQEDFAKRFRVSVDALQHWEQGRGKPLGPVEVILDSIEKQLRESKAQKQPA